MKTISQIKKDIEAQMELIADQITASKKKKPKPGSLSLLEMMRICEAYLETNPNEDFIKSSLEKVKQRLAKINSGFGDWLTSNDFDGTLKQKKDHYNKEFETKKIKIQINALTYILN